MDAGNDHHPVLYMGWILSVTIAAVTMDNTKQYRNTGASWALTGNPQRWCPKESRRWLTQFSRLLCLVSYSCLKDKRRQHWDLVIPTCTGEIPSEEEAVS